MVIEEGSMRIVFCIKDKDIDLRDIVYYLRFWRGSLFWIVCVFLSFKLFLNRVSSEIILVYYFEVFF